MAFDAIVLAGGATRRMDGRDKADIEIGGVRLLDRVLAAVCGAEQIVLVGPPRGVPGVIECREQPAGAGPVAGLAAGLAHGRAEFVVVLAVDLPWIAPAVSVLLAALAAAPGMAGAVLVDADGRRNYLAAAWRRGDLTAAIAGLPSVEGAAMRSLYDAMSIVDVRDSGEWGLDCDTAADVERARRREQVSRER